MSSRILSPARETALVALLDDDSPVVQEALLAELKRLDDVGLSLLRKVVREASSHRVAAAQRLLEKLEGPDPVAEVQRFIESLHYELETGLLLFSRVSRPELDLVVQQRQIEAIARRCRDLMPAGVTAWERCKVLNRVIFHEYGFRPNHESPDDPNNEVLGAVLMRRKGGPILLGLLYLLVAERCDLDLDAVNMPQNFFVGYFREAVPFYIDPIERGRFRLPDEVEQLLVSQEIGLPPSQLMAPAPVGEVLCRLCHHLVHLFSLRNNPRQAKLFAGFVRAFQDTYRRHAES